MKIGFVSPYFDSLGGGERYMLSIASRVSGEHTVHVFWDDPKLLKKAADRFNLNLNLVSIVPNIFSHGSPASKVFGTRSYDMLFFLTDGSIPMSSATHNVLHMQVPFSHIRMPFWKKWRYDAVIYNSRFTKEKVDTVIHSMPSRIIYPPVTPITVSKAAKSNMILSVGRFGGLYNAKKFDILLEAFRQLLTKKQFNSYTLAFAGGLLPSDAASYEMLKKKASSLPVTFYPDCTYTQLISLYEQSVVYWHAAGFGETNPERMEHFGISTVEAMSAGAIPLVFNGGGQPEIVTDGENGFLWNTTDELIQKTSDILENGGRRKEISGRSIASAVRFSTEVFNREIDRLLSDIQNKRKI